MGDQATSGTEDESTPGISPPGRTVAPWTQWLRRTDQQVIGAAVAILLVAMAIWWYGRGGGSGALIEIDRAEPRRIDFQVDLNRASWAELSLLPGVGEARAKAIVASRETEGPFRHPNDLRRIRGFGPRTLENVLPYLSPLPGEEVFVDGGRRSDPIE